MDRDPAIEEKLKGFLKGRPRQYKPTTQGDLLKQLNGVADMLATVVKERDIDRDRLIQAVGASETAKLWTRILLATVLVEAGIIAFAFNQLFSRLH